MIQTFTLRFVNPELQTLTVKSQIFDPNLELRKLIFLVAKEDYQIESIPDDEELTLVP